uniref:Uncharacterized protein n=1 Tax=Anguilla anguilla TaxID=7936 RepID=A0A0E9V0Z8_ANGAN
MLVLEDLIKESQTDSRLEKRPIFFKII